MRRFSVVLALALFAGSLGVPCAALAGGVGSSLKSKVVKAPKKNAQVRSAGYTFTCSPVYGLSLVFTPNNYTDANGYVWGTLDATGTIDCQATTYPAGCSGPITISLELDARVQASAGPPAIWTDWYTNMSPFMTNSFTSGNMACANVTYTQDVVIYVNDGYTETQANTIFAGLGAPWGPTLSGSTINYTGTATFTAPAGYSGSVPGTQTITWNGTAP